MMMNPACYSRFAALVVGLAAWAGLGASGQAQETVALPTMASVDPAPLPAPDANASTAALGGTGSSGDYRSPFERLSFGGYGEIHANSVEGPGNDEIDLHRLILSTQYDFTSWLSFVSELEIEHAFISRDTASGELLFEQAYVEYAACDWLRVRAGRVLVPLGLVNLRHEPTAFNGVERPSFTRVIIPSTWFADGIGLRGWFGPALTYHAYLLSSLDGSRFNALDGIRNGRIKERSSMHDPAFSARIDYFPFAVAPCPGEQFLRFGASTFVGGLDNGNRGRDPGIEGDISVVSTDFEYRLSCFELRGEFALEDIEGAQQIGNGTASEILGWYLEAALHILPERWRCGRLEKADAVVFVRYDDFNTQYKMPPGVAKNNAGDRTEWTTGFGFFPVPNFVVKADYQIPDDATANNLPNRFNVGIGWQF